MNLIKYFIYVFKNRKHIQEQNWNIGAYERTLETHVKDLEALLQIKIGDIRKYNYLTHPDCFNHETIQLEKSDIVEVFDKIQHLSCYMEKPCGEREFIHASRKYMYK